METLKIPVRGEVKRSTDTNNRTISFESGSEQIQRLWINPRVIFTVNCEGDDDMRKYLIAFFDAVHGNYDKFLWTYDGETMTCRFGEPRMDITEIREYGTGNVVGYKANFSIKKCRSSE